MSWRKQTCRHPDVWSPDERKVPHLEGHFLHTLVLNELNALLSQLLQDREVSCAFALLSNFSNQRKEGRMPRLPPSTLVQVADDVPVIVIVRASSQHDQQSSTHLNPSDSKTLETAQTAWSLLELLSFTRLFQLHVEHVLLLEKVALQRALRDAPPRALRPALPQFPRPSPVAPPRHPP